MLTMSLNDPRIPAYATLKFVEKLRDRAADLTRMPNFGNKNIVVRIRKDESAGHFGSADNNVSIEEEC
jgi:protease II